GSTPVPEVAEEDVVLVPQRVLGAQGDQPVSGQVSIGRSEPERLRPDSEGLDAALARAVAEDDDRHHYYRVWLTCTFHKHQDPVVEARLSVELRQAGYPGVRDPVV